MEKIRIIKKSQNNFIHFICDNHLCIAKVMSEPSEYGIDNGRISKLTISKGKKWEGLGKAIYNYDRGLDFDNAPKKLISKILKKFS